MQWSDAIYWYIDTLIHWCVVFTFELDKTITKMIINNIQRKKIKILKCFNQTFECQT